ncbi:hypothetical protein KCU98_g1675, partial [Aureobasidium melanogenum]
MAGEADLAAEGQKLRDKMRKATKRTRAASSQGPPNPKRHQPSPASTTASPIIAPAKPSSHPNDQSAKFKEKQMDDLMQTGSLYESSVTIKQHITECEEDIKVGQGAHAYSLEHRIAQVMEGTEGMEDFWRPLRVRLINKRRLELLDNTPQLLYNPWFEKDDKLKEWLTDCVGIDLEVLTNHVELGYLRGLRELREEHGFRQAVRCYITHRVVELAKDTFVEKFRGQMP